MQRRACKANCCLILFPVLVCVLLGGLQTFMDNLFKNLGGDKPDCKVCDGRTGGGGVRLSEDAVGGLSCSPSCPLPVAQRWPVVLLLPGSKGDALNFSALMEMDNKPPPCVSPESCTAPAKFLVTGGNKSFAQSLTGNMFPPHASPNLTADISGLADYALAIDGTGFGTSTYEAAFDRAALYFLQSKCAPKSTLSFPVQHGPKMDNKEFLAIVQASNAYLQLRGNDTKTRFGFVEDMPRDGHPIKAPDMSFIVGKLVFIQIIMLLFLTCITYQVTGATPFGQCLREIVDRFLQQPDTSYSVIIDNIRKVYPPKDGNAEVVAVKGFSLSIQRGQCFGLGSNGTGKTSLISMAAEQSLKALQIFDGGVADTLVSQYSGGMKRRLSVAISLIGDPKVVYLDEPSTGLDPASRSALWNALKFAKKDKAIILTTHSMKEAEALCDRIGIAAYGRLRCTGTSKELEAKYGGTFVFTVTASAGEDEAVERLVRSISPAAKRTYHIAGTQKFELPKQGVRIAEVFRAVEQAKRSLNIAAWGLVDTTLEDVFIKVDC
ncbi:unnamed protein product [Miscanthus lutarioriparius]|uniref:ABC transporter domain-containing protein n=1 Tax=Miscanthus lutarioriparius TaxID=422564 RepID=A0A811Q4A7_9POAL|nr:unnamed protein product [Miscanthus lutarioriparius]